MIELQRESLTINKLIAEKKEIIFVEGDMIVPDSKPDILNTICTSGVVSIYKQEVQDEKVRIDGCINTYIMYMPDEVEDTVRGLNTVLDFSENINLPNTKEGMEVIVDANMKSIEARVINGRKVGIKATLEIYLKVYQNENVEVINNIQNDEGIQILKEDLKVNSLVDCGKTRINVKENIQIDSTDNLAEILKAQISIVDKDCKISYNKVLTKAEVQAEIMYLTEDNRISTVTYKIPAVGFIDIPNVQEGNICDVTYTIKNIIIKPNAQEDHSIYVEIELEVYCYVYEEKQINLIQDIYSPTQNIDFNKRTITTMTDKCNMSNIKQIRENVNLPDTEGKRLIDVDVFATVLNEDKINSKILYDAELDLRFIFEDQRNQIDVRNVKIPFNFVIDNLEKGETLNTENLIEIKSKDFIIQNDGNIDVNIDLQIHTNMNRNANINTIEDIEEGNQRDEQDYSVVIYIVQKGDTLWNIAKKFGSTVEGIARVNGIESEDLIMPGQKLYIPKYERILEKNYE